MKSVPAVAAPEVFAGVEKAAVLLLVSCHGMLATILTACAVVPSALHAVSVAGDNSILGACCLTGNVATTCGVPEVVRTVTIAVLSDVPVFWFFG